MTEIGKIVEFVSTSKVSFEDAVKKAVEDLSKKESDVRGFKIKNVSVQTKNGKIVGWRVNLKGSASV
jgi:flavin-binding protein dodecin